MQEQIAQLLYELYGRHTHYLPWTSQAAAVQELYLNRASTVLALIRGQVERLEFPSSHKVCACNMCKSNEALWQRNVSFVKAAVLALLTGENK